MAVNTVPMISAGIPGKHVIGYWAKRNNEQLLIESLEDLQKNDLILGAMTQVGRKANTEGNKFYEIYKIYFLSIRKAPRTPSSDIKSGSRDLDAYFLCCHWVRNKAWR